MTAVIARQATRLLVVWIAAALVITSAMAAAPAAAQLHERQVFLTVLDKSGAVVKDLSARDFSVREGGATREVTAAELALDPLVVSILVDTTQPPPGWDAGTQDLRKALASFVDAVLAGQEGASVSLGEFAGAAVTTVPFTTKAELLQSAIQKIYQGQRPGGVLLEALIDASRQLTPQQTPRREIVSIDFNSTESSQVQPTKVVTAVHDSGATLWAVSITRTGDNQKADNFATSASPRESVLSKLPDATGGQHLRIIGTSSLEATLLKLADILSHQYLVTYRSPNAGPVPSIAASSPRGATVLRAPMMR
jgi:VWFA-related protein